VAVGIAGPTLKSGTALEQEPAEVGPCDAGGNLQPVPLEDRKPAGFDPQAELAGGKMAQLELPVRAGLRLLRSLPARRRVGGDGPAGGSGRQLDAGSCDRAAAFVHDLSESRPPPAEHEAEAGNRGSRL